MDNIDSYMVLWKKEHKMDIGDILLNDLNDKVKISGLVTDKYDDVTGSTINYIFLDVEDDSGSITVFISGDLYAISGSRGVVPEVNQTIQIIGMVKEFNNQLEIIPSNTTKGAIKILEE